MWVIDDELLLFLYIPDSLLSPECWASSRQAGLDKHQGNLTMSTSPLAALISIQEEQVAEARWLSLAAGLRSSKTAGFRDYLGELR